LISGVLPIASTTSLLIFMLDIAACWWVEDRP
jgi:hypothetical protein